MEMLTDSYELLNRVKEIIASKVARSMLNLGSEDRGAWGHSIRFWRLAPFPFAGLPIVASDAALDHFVAPFVARQDEANEIAAAKAKPAKGNHDNDLQQHLVT